MGDVKRILSEGLCPLERLIETLPETLHFSAYCGVDFSADSLPGVSPLAAGRHVPELTLSGACGRTGDRGGDGKKALGVDGVGALGAGHFHVSGIPSHSILTCF